MVRLLATHNPLNPHYFDYSYVSDNFLNSDGRDFTSSKGTFLNSEGRDLTSSRGTFLNSEGLDFPSSRGTFLNSEGLDFPSSRGTFLNSEGLDFPSSTVIDYLASTSDALILCEVLLAAEDFYILECLDCVFCLLNSSMVCKALMLLSFLELLLYT